MLHQAMLAKNRIQLRDVAAASDVLRCFIEQHFVINAAAGKGTRLATDQRADWRLRLEEGEQ
jgi:hypothetical protein